MGTTKIELIKPLDDCCVGTVLSVTDAMGKKLIEDGIAARYGTVERRVEKAEPVKPGPTKTKLARGRKRK